MAARLARQKATVNLIENLLSQVHFTETPSKSIQCLLCKQILKNPLQLSCGHRVCKGCDEKSKVENVSSERYCPEDGEIIENTFPDRSALTEIMHLPCFCLSQVEGCNWEGLLLELEDHIGACEFNVKSLCPYHEFHCTFTASKKNMDKHIREGYRKHDSLVAVSLSEVLNNVHENKLLVDTVKVKMMGIEKSFTDSSEKTLLLQTMLNNVSHQINGEDMTVRLKAQVDKVEELMRQSGEKKGKFLSFQTKFKELVNNVEKQMSYVNDAQSKDGKDKATGSKKSLVDKVERLAESNKSHDTQLADLAIKIRIYQCSSSDGKYIWKLDSLRSRFTEALSAKVEELYTPPLYTSLFGYKYSAKVMLYGSVKDKVVDNNVRHLAFYIVIMQGDYDEILKFPFPYPITVTLLNTSKKADLTHILYPDPNKAHFQKPYRNMNPAIGFSKFCTHDRLYADGFVKDDAIYFRITVNKTGIDVKEPDI